LKDGGGRPVFGGKKEEDNASPKIASTYGRESRVHEREARDRPWSQAGAKPAASSPTSGAKARPTRKASVSASPSTTPKAAAPKAAAPKAPEGSGTSRLAPRGAVPTGGSSPRTPRRRGTDKEPAIAIGAAAKKKP